MTRKFHVNVVQFGVDRLSRDLGPLCVGLAQSLRAPGNGRHALTCSFESPTNAKDLATALNAQSFITVVAGHGWRPEMPETSWRLGRSKSREDGCVTFEELRGQGVSIPAQVLIVDACYADDAQDEWLSLLHQPGYSDLVLGHGIVGLPDAARWLSNLLLSFAGLTGEKELTAWDREIIWTAVINSLNAQEQSHRSRVRSSFRIWTPANSPSEYSGA